MNYLHDVGVNLPECWLKYIDKTILDNVTSKLLIEINNNKDSEFYPYNINDVFKIFHLCKLEDIKVVILGQDPYYANKHQANGIAFSVNENVNIPPSLRNIYKEANIKSKNGNLTSWVSSGVFLLNASLTVKQKNPNSHEYIWKEFIKHIIDIIYKNCENVIFVSWGNSAKLKYLNLNMQKHILLTSSHPSPLSCYKTDSPFIGSDIFNRINDILIKQNKGRINWTNLI